MWRPRDGAEYSASETDECTAVSEVEVRGEVGQLARDVSDRGYARHLLTVAAWTPRAAPATARRRHGCLHLVMIVQSCEYARYNHLLDIWISLHTYVSPGFLSCSAFLSWSTHKLFPFAFIKGIVCISWRWKCLATRGPERLSRAGKGYCISWSRTTTWADVSSAYVKACLMFV